MSIWTTEAAIATITLRERVRSGVSEGLAEAMAAHLAKPGDPDTRVWLLRVWTQRAWFAPRQAQRDVLRRHPIRQSRALSAA